VGKVQALVDKVRELRKQLAHAELELDRELATHETAIKDVRRQLRELGS
jgi:hypothetical protein